MPEIWKPVLNGWYEVSSLGRVRSVDRVTHDGRRWKGRVLKPAPSGNTRLMFNASVNGKKSTPCIHALVALKFLGPRPRGLVINHKDGNYLNNAASNLEYTTTAKNAKHAAALGLMPTKANGRWHRP